MFSGPNASPWAAGIFRSPSAAREGSVAEPGPVPAGSGWAIEGESVGRRSQRRPREATSVNQIQCHAARSWVSGGMPEACGIVGVLTGLEQTRVGGGTPGPHPSSRSQEGRGAANRSPASHTSSPLGDPRQASLSLDPPISKMGTRLGLPEQPVGGADGHESCLGAGGGAVGVEVARDAEARVPGAAPGCRQGPRDSRGHRAGLRQRPPSRGAADPALGLRAAVWRCLQLGKEEECPSLGWHPVSPCH